VGSLVEEMKRKGYQGPYANVCDGVIATMFHGPAVSLDPAWVEPANNVFQMRVLDCEAFCRNTLLFTFGEDGPAIDALFKQARAEPGRFCERRPIPDTLHMPCLLSYPRSGESAPDGAHFFAEAMEDLWNVFQFDGHFYFTRSWTGQLMYRAKLQYRPGALFITEVEASQTRPKDVYGIVLDEELAVRQVDFLVKALLYQLPVPAPLPRRLSEENRGTMALFALTEYGRWGWFPTFDDTTEYRLCLNGRKGRYPHRAENAFLPLIHAVQDHDSLAHRQRLLDQLRGRSLYFAFSVPEDALKQGAITDDTPIYFDQHQWHGRPSAFAYTDPAFRIEPSHGCVDIKSSGWWAFVRERTDEACLVINPGGPATCILEPTELKALAQ
jgi:hypothetical protein